MELLDSSIIDVQRAVLEGRASAAEIAEAVLERIERDASGCYLDVDRARTLDQARRVDDKRARGEALGALAGVPIGLVSGAGAHKDSQTDRAGVGHGSTDNAQLVIQGGLLIHLKQF